MAIGTRAVSAVGMAPTRNRPDATSRKERKSPRAASKRATIAAACGAKDSPAAVRRTPRGSRSKSGVPSEASSTDICRETADCV